MKSTFKIAVPFLTIALASSSAFAHVSLAGPGFANATFMGVFGVGHGCSGSDTYSVKIQIPAGVTSVRAVDSLLGKAVSDTDSTGAITAVSWTKNVADVIPTDIDFYQVTIRMKLPNTPFATVYFPTTQICRDSLGNVLPPVEWIGTGNEVASPDGAPPPEPAPKVVLLPARFPGWNKYTVASELTDLSIFNDAEIVWAGNAAYSVNTNYKTLISTEPNTTALTLIAANTDIWVKY